MPHLEIEVKAALPNPEEVLKKILATGALFKETKYQHDILLDPPHTDFAKTDQVLRIRNTNGTWKLDYKGPRLDNETKTRKEYSLTVEEGKQLRDIFTLMGFIIVGEIEKTRDVYTLKNMKITFDKVTHLGNFIEVEVKGDETTFEQTKKDIFAYLTSLGLQETIRKDYLELLWEKGFFKK